MSGHNHVTYVLCPICGSQILVSTIGQHVGSTRCKMKYLERGAVCVDLEFGPKVLELATMLNKTIRDYRHKKASK